MPTDFNRDLDIVKDANEIWVQIIDKAWKSQKTDDELKLMVLRIACKFPSDAVDKVHNINNL